MLFMRPLFCSNTYDEEHKKEDGLNRDICLYSLCLDTQWQVCCLSSVSSTDAYFGCWKAVITSHGAWLQTDRLFLFGWQTVYWLLLEILWYQIKQYPNMFLFVTQLEVTVNDTDMSPLISLPPRCQRSKANIKNIFIRHLFVTRSSWWWSEINSSLFLQFLCSYAVH